MRTTWSAAGYDIAMPGCSIASSSFSGVFFSLQRDSSRAYSASSVWIFCSHFRISWPSWAHLESITQYTNTKVTISKDVYGLDSDTITVAVSAVVLARDDVSEDAIYKLVADIFDNAASLTDTHAKYAEVSTEFGASVTSVPYHPGAAKYFEELKTAGKL